MLDWIKFFPFASRDDNNPLEVRGPYFTKPKTVKWTLGDNRLFFNAPRSNPVFSLSRRGSSFESVLPKRTDILKGDWQVLYASDHQGPLSEWEHQLFYLNTWFFIGPWFAGEQSRLKVSGILISAKADSSFKGKSLFQPRIFESAIADSLDNCYGYSRTSTGKKPHHRGPLNWRVLPISSSIQAVVCDIHTIGNTNKDNPKLTRELYIPISEHQLICIHFSFGGTSIYHDDIRSKPMFELCNSIIDSMRLEVGEQTQAEWNKVKATCPDMSITETFGELPWPLKVEKSSEKCKEVDITPRPDRLEFESKG